MGWGGGGGGSVIGKLNPPACANPRYFSLDAVGVLLIWNELDSKFELSAGFLSTMVYSSKQHYFFLILVQGNYLPTQTEYFFGTKRYG